MLDQPVLNEPARQLRARLEDRSAKVAVIGVGYVGLPLLLAFNQARFPVLGVDVDPVKVAHLKAGRSYIGTIPSARLQAMNADGAFDATTDFSRLGEADAILICVPTPLDEAREPDLSYVIKTGEAIARHLRPGQLVSLESTTYPGTTEEVLKPILEASGLRADPQSF